MHAPGVGHRSGFVEQAISHMLAVLLLASLSSFPTATAGQQKKLDAEVLVRRGRDLMQRGEKKLGRGYISLALHLDPFIPYEKQEFSAWLPQMMHTEPRHYWKGSVFIGHDKTYLESLFSKLHIFTEREKSSLALFTWRNLQLTGLSCCGMDNVAVFFQQAQKHMYLIPFLNLVPGSGERLKPENQAMYTSFKAWWEENGRRPMPEPSVSYHGSGKFGWDALKVVFKASRVVKGWTELVQAVLALNMENPEAARLCLQAALRTNPDLRQTANELLPSMRDAPVPTLAPTTPAAQRKYVVCYNPHVGLGNLAVVMTSAHILAKLTGRTFLLHWNVNTVSKSAFKLREQSGAQLLTDWASSEETVFSGSVKHLYLFHMMWSEKLGEALELLGCSDLDKALGSHRVVTVSSNLFFAPLLRVNPHTPEGTVPDFPEMLHELFAPSDRSAKKALDYAKSVQWGKEAPVVAIHIRSREEGEDNDDWPTASSPNRYMLEKLASCIQTAVARELKGAAKWDVYIASTTKAARSAVQQTLEGKVPGLRRVLQLKPLLKRSEHEGAEDAMAEALLISRAEVFVRLVIGSTGFSTFAYLSNALRTQNDWVTDMPGLKRSGFAPNYLVTEACGPGRCFLASPEVRMASISWHGKQYTQRSCGDVVQKVDREGSGPLGCRALERVDGSSQDSGNGEL